MKVYISYSLLVLLAILQMSVGETLSQEKNFDVAVPSALLMEPRTGTVIYQKDQHKRLVPASLVKIMTLLLTFEFVKEKNISLDTVVKVSREASLIGGRQIYLKERESITVEELIKSAAIFSANDAAYALAQMVAGTEDRFVAMMNDKAKELGLTNTYFNNSHGLPGKSGEEQQYTTAYDLALLARHVFFYYPEMFKYTTIKNDTIRNGAFELVTTNNLMFKRDDVYGLKTGYIRASGFCVVNMARQGDFNLIAVVMGANSKQERFSIASRMLDYGFSTCGYKTITQLPNEIAIPVIDGIAESVPVILATPITIVIPKNKDIKLKFSYQTPVSLVAPVLSQQWVGRVIISAGEHHSVSATLLTSGNVEQNNSILARLKRLFRRKNVSS
ncbi:MAG: D-alanyl-D-alanine carboxypeptidase family protein [Candidatus Auribacterota bacterium]|jgi:D-alanyl-D-alanine carboxypeptidase (penicillin-binding protein 5/6)|nr:D-alanyl-D-alanine carboxypeptidase family protein [Candidatus Auribacterota bacterium]